jgi:hypothetical protein
MADHRVAPGPDEAAVFSALAVRADGRWQVAAGSLLTCAYDVATTSWRRWAKRQPQTRGAGPRDDGPDFGPNFAIDPVPGLRALRRIVASNEWRGVYGSLTEGEISAHGTKYIVNATGWTSRVFLESEPGSDAHNVVCAARRPVSGIVGTLAAPEPPPATPFLELAAPPTMPRGPDLGHLHRHRSLVHWPEELTGVRWVIPDYGTPIFPIPPKLVVGRMQTDAWIVDTLPNYETGNVDVTIGWDERAIDPLGCSLLPRSASDELTLLTRQIRISDLPANDGPVTEGWRLPWNERQLTVAVPRGPRRTDWGVALFAADGRLLDERRVATRAERIEIEINTMGSKTTGPVSLVGDPAEGPTVEELDVAVDQAVAIEHEARAAAAQRRFSTAGELEHYLRWRMSCRAGEVVILDPSLVRGSDEQARRPIEFMASLGRPIRALSGSITESVRQLLDVHPEIDVRALPDGAASLHDRIWLLGETGLAVGASPDGFLPKPGSTRRASTATELSHGDAALWRTQFEDWWGRTRPAESGVASRSCS